MQTNRFVSLVVTLSAFILPSSLPAFEGRIELELTRGGNTTHLRYTVGADTLRIERTSSDRPSPKNLISLDRGATILLYPHNRGFVRLTEPTAAPTSTPPALDLPAMPALPAMPMMPPPHREPLALTATGETTNLFGYACTRYEIRRRGEVMEIWATDQLLPYQPWLRNQPHRLAPRMLEEQWGDLLKQKGLFPLKTTLRFDQGAERFRFEVISIQEEEITDSDGSLFQPPPDYHEMETFPF